MLTTLFRQLEGTWKLDRQLQTKTGSEPQGRCEGTATFSVTAASDVGPGLPQQSGVEEMLYHEEGSFQISNWQGPTFGKLPPMTFSKEYIWRLTSSDTSGGPRLSVWFTKPGTVELDYLFHEVEVKMDHKVLKSGMKIKAETAIVAVGEHLCVNDMYYSEYGFDVKYEAFEDAPNPTLVQWSTEHVVKGPKKDQRITTNFTK